MKLFDLGLSNNLFREETAELNKQRCLRRFARSECQFCASVCPVRAIRIDGYPIADRASCVGCGVCVTKCPTGALNVLTASASDVATEVATSRVHRFVCSIASRGEMGVRVPCIGFVDVAMLLLAARKWGSVAVDARKCRDCPLACVLGDVKLKVARANALLEALGRRASIELLTDTTALDSEALRPDCTRRELFSYVKAEAAKSLINMLNNEVAPFVSALQPEGPYISHRAFARQIVLLGADAQTVLRSVEISDHPSIDGVCTFCGICAKACPEAAIAIVDERVTAALALILPRCSACGLCVDICPTKAMAMAGKTTLADVLKGRNRVVGKTSKSRCSECGQEILGDGDLCSRCRKGNDLLASISALTGKAR